MVRYYIRSDTLSMLRSATHRGVTRSKRTKYGKFLTYQKTCDYNNPSPRGYDTLYVGLFDYITSIITPVELYNKPISSAYTIRNNSYVKIIT